MSLPIFTATLAAASVTAENKPSAIGSSVASIDAP
jgi:hypothetical protein